MCWASAALPPLPMIRSLLPELSAPMIVAAISRALARNSGSRTARSSAAKDSARCAAIGSLESWLKTYPRGYAFAPLVMAAPTLCKHATSTCQAGARCGQHAFGDSSHIGGGNVAHAAVLVHGADRAMARLTRRHGFRLHRGRQPIQRRPMIRACRTENAHGWRSQSGGDMHQPRIV